MADDTFDVKPVDSLAGRFELKLRGKIYADAAPQLRATVDRLADGGLAALVVDASELLQIDSSGLNVFVHLLKRIRPKGGRVAFYGLNANLKRVFEITKLGTVLEVLATRDEALRSVA